MGSLLERVLYFLKKNYRKHIKGARKGFVQRDGDKIRFFCHEHDFSVTVDGSHVKHENYDDWLLLQILKGKPDWLEKNWSLTKEKQKKNWAFAGLRRGMRMLEVGFRDGHNLQYLQQEGVDVEGIDVNKFAVKHALKLGCKAYEEDIQEGSHYSNQEFGLISACDVLEHCFAPEKALLEMHRILRNDGNLAIEIPFEDDFSENLAHGHSALFKNFEYAEKLFQEAGFHVIKSDLTDPTRNLFLLRKKEALS
jgi:SAM-dependent methyltransferase